MYKIVMFAGRIEMDFMGDFHTYEEAEEICESYGWGFSMMKMNLNGA